MPLLLLASISLSRNDATRPQLRPRLRPVEAFAPACATREYGKVQTLILRWKDEQVIERKKTVRTKAAYITLNA